MRDGRIALFVPAMDDGGAQVVFAQLASVWAAKGHSVDLVTARSGGENLHRLDRRVRFVDLGASRTLTALHPLARYLRRTRPTILMSAIEHGNIIAHWAHRLARTDTRHVCSAHNHIGPLIRPPGRLQAMAGRMLVSAYRRADGVLAISRAVGSDVAESTGLDARDIRVIHNPLAPSRILESASEPVSFPEQRPVFVGVGRLEEVKDWHTALLGFARVRAVRGGRFLLLGQGSQRAALGELVRRLGISDAVDFLGYRQNPYPWMARADAVVQTSQREGFGMVIAEALALGTQVVSTRAGGGPEEVLGHGAFGHLAEVGSADSVAAAMLRALDAPIPRERLLERAATFDAETIAERYLTWFEELRRGSIHDRRSRATRLPRGLSSLPVARPDP